MKKASKLGGKGDRLVWTKSQSVDRHHKVKPRCQSFPLKDNDLKYLEGKWPENCTSHRRSHDRKWSKKKSKRAKLKNEYLYQSFPLADRNLSFTGPALQPRGLTHKPLCPHHRCDTHDGFLKRKTLVRFGVTNGYWTGKDGTRNKRSEDSVLKILASSPLAEGGGLIGKKDRRTRTSRTIPPSNKMDEGAGTSKRVRKEDAKMDEKRWWCRTEGEKFGVPSSLCLPQTAMPLRSERGEEQRQSNFNLRQGQRLRM